MEPMPTGKIQMIKWVRETTKCSLREALDIVTTDLIRRHDKNYEDLTVGQVEEFMHRRTVSNKSGERLTAETEELMMTVRRFNARWNTEWTLIPLYEMTDQQKIHTYKVFTEVLDGSPS